MPNVLYIPSRSITLIMIYFLEREEACSIKGNDGPKRTKTIATVISQSRPSSRFAEIQKQNHFLNYFCYGTANSLHFSAIQNHFVPVTQRPGLGDVGPSGLPFNAWLSFTLDLASLSCQYIDCLATDLVFAST